MTSEVVYIVNPVSGRGRTGRRWQEIQSKLGSVDVRFTKAHGDGADLARQAVQEGTKTVVACGGDGTINEVASALIATDATLGILPLGTGNDFARATGLFGSSSDPVSAIKNGQPRLIDTIRWECGDRSGISINIAGCGFDAMVAERINRGYRLVRGQAAYIAAVLGTLADYQPAPVKLTLDDEILETSIMLCAVANATSYGGGMKVAPNAKIDDGLLDVVVVQGLSKFQFLKAFPSVFRGAHLDHPKVLSRRATRVQVESAISLPVLADGELVGTTPASFEISPASLRVLLP
jgi:diacylglycerol kinase (ATP)